MSQTLYKKHNYLRKDYNYLRKTFIAEYDIHSAGLNILYRKGLITDVLYNYLNSLEKLNRNILIGNLLKRKPSWNRIMMKEYVYIMKEFMEINNIDDNDILSIKKDSLILINQRPNNLLIDDIYQFRQMNKFNFFLYLGKDYEFYFNSNEMTYSFKGFGENVINKLENTFFNFIFTCMSIDSEEDKDELFIHIKNFRSQYLNYELPKEYYFDIDDEAYVLQENGLKYTSSEIYEEDKKKLIITGNYRYLLKLIEIFLLK